MWEFLQDFWDDFTYPVDPLGFFEDIWDIISGAVIDFFNFFFHNFNDLLVFFGWLFNNLWHLIEKILSPVVFVFIFLKTFFNNAIASVETETLWAMPDEVMAIFEGLPLWTAFTTAIGVALLVLLTFGILKKLSRI